MHLGLVLELFIKVVPIFLYNKVKKSKKVFDKGQKVRYTLTMKKNKKSNMILTFIKKGCY